MLLDGFNLTFMMPATNQPPVATCTKCKIRHERPVGTRCKRALNMDNAEDNSITASRDDQQDAVQDNLAQTPNNSRQQEDIASDASKSRQIESKLDLLLTKMVQLEENNKALEKKVDKQGKQLAGASSLSHSSQMYQ